MNVLIVEYPGYSIYNEDKSADVVLQDSLFVFDYITKILGFESKNIFVFGRSIGSGPSCYLSSERLIGGLMLMSPFTSLKTVVKNLIGFLSFLVSER